MVQPKHKKPSKSKRQDSGKKLGKKADLTQFRLQLDALGLKVIEMTPDGNCFFRALADQLEGSEEEHKKFRDMVVQYIVNHRLDFEPFIEDEVPFEEYCKTMADDGTWAGNMELQAASLVTQSNICIHRLMSPRWYIRNFPSHDARMIHLSYHGGEHYNSVRLKEDPCVGPAMRITIKVDADIAKVSHQSNDLSNAIARGSNIDTSSVKLVMRGTGCESYSKAEQILKDVDGDVDAAIEYLIAEERMNDDADANDEHFAGCSNSHDLESCKEQSMDDGHVEFISSMCKSTLGSINNHGEYSREKVLREKKPPQLSKKKQHMNGNEKSNLRKTKKDRRNLKKEPACNLRTSTTDNGNLPDVGALCI